MSWVSVPVLSVHSTSIAPKFWIELSRFTMARFFDMAMAPLARFTVTIIGSISGVRPTATASAKSSASSQLPLVRPLMRNTAGTMTTMKTIIRRVKPAMPRSKLVCCGWLSAILSASPPKNVALPVSSTTPVAAPLTTLLPM